MGKLSAYEKTHGKVNKAILHIGQVIVIIAVVGLVASLGLLGKQKINNGVIGIIFFSIIGYAGVLIAKLSQRSEKRRMERIGKNIKKQHEEKKKGREGRFIGKKQKNKKKFIKRKKK